MQKECEKVETFSHSFFGLAMLKLIVDFGIQSH